MGGQEGRRKWKKAQGRSGASDTLENLPHPGKGTLGPEDQRVAKAQEAEKWRHAEGS